MRTYQHREINADHDYKVWYVSEGCTQEVLNSKPDYLQWLADGGVPEVVPYVEPPLEDLEDLRLRAFTVADTRFAEQMAAGFAFGDYVIDTTPKNRELLIYFAQLAPSKPDNYTKGVKLKDGTTVVLTKAEILQVYPAMLLHGEGLYDVWFADYEMLTTADREALNLYITG